MENEEWIKRRMELFGVPLNKWQKVDLIEEVIRLRELNKGYHQTVVDLQGIKGRVSTAEIDAALNQNVNKKTK